MVAPPSFDGPFVGPASLLRPGTPGESSNRTAGGGRVDPGASAPQAAAASARTDPVRGTRPVFQQLSSPFVAQFIAQELDPPAPTRRTALATERALAAYQQRLVRVGGG